MSINFQEILKELEYRVEHGIIDLNKEQQVTTLAEILRENGVSDANEMAQKARVYFSYINEAPKKEPLDKVLAKSFKNPETGNNVRVASALGYDKKTQAYNIAKGMMKKSGYSEKDVDMVDTTDDDAEQPIKGKSVFGKGKGANVFDKGTPKQTKSGKAFVPSKEDIARKQLDDKKLLEIVKFGLIPSAEKQLKGAGVFDPTEKQLLALKEVTEKQLKDPSYRLELPKYEVSEEHINRTIEVMKNELGKDFTKVKQSITKAGGVASELTTGEAGVQRFRDIVQLYLSNGGRSVVTGEVVPFNQMQLDHHIPYSNAGKIVAEKKKKGIKTTILAEQDRLDSPDNWDLIETPLNQLKNSLEGSALLDRVVKKLSASPDDKELVRLKNEIVAIRREKLQEYFIKSVGAGDFSGINEDSLKKMNPDERMALMKAWNFWHPNIMEFNSIMKLDPTYEKKLKKMGINPPPPDNKFHIDRYQAGKGVRARGVRRPVPDEVKVVATTMVKAGVKLQTKKTLDATNSILDRGRKMVEKEAGVRQQQIDLIKAKQKGKK
jgi:hypothetical protein